MPHQKAMVFKMLDVEKRCFGSRKSAYAMMSDKAGAGKSYAILAFLFITNRIIFKNKRPHVNLIVVPYNICSQWFTYMQNIYANNNIRYKTLIEYKDMISLYADPTDLLGFDILLTTSLYFDMLAKTLKSLGLQVERVFFDEADTIKNLLMTELNCNMTWFVSASMPSLFGASSNVTIGKYHLDLDTLTQNNVKCDVDFVNDHIVLEPPVVHSVKIDNVYFDLLRRLVPPSQHMRLHAMDLSCVRCEHVSEFINLTSEYHACLYLYKAQYGHITYCEDKILSLEEDYKNTQKKLAVAKIVNTSLAKELEESLHAITRSIEENKETINTCNSLIAMIENFKTKHGVAGFFDPLVTQSKVDPIHDILVKVRDDPSRQCILFTDYDYIYSLLRSFMHKNIITFKDLDGGNIDAMDKIIGSYKRREFQVLLADSSMYSCGMNLENTSDICFIHQMNEHKEKQVIGRAHRYGRDGRLNVHHMIYTT